MFCFQSALPSAALKARASPFKISGKDLLPVAVFQAAVIPRNQIQRCANRVCPWRMTTGDSAFPGPDEDERHDIVMMDNFIYGEPQLLLSGKQTVSVTEGTMIGADAYLCLQCFGDAQRNSAVKPA